MAVEVSNKKKCTCIPKPVPPPPPKSVGCCNGANANRAQIHKDINTLKAIAKDAADREWEEIAIEPIPLDVMKEALNAVDDEPIDDLDENEDENEELLTT